MKENLKLEIFVIFVYFVIFCWVKKKILMNIKIIGCGGCLIFDFSDGCLFFCLWLEILINIYKMFEKCLI